jgi:PAS domain S-box-containing protein
MVRGDLHMSLTDTQIQFAAEFITLIVAASGIALAVLRPPGVRPAFSVMTAGSYREISAAGAVAVLGFVIAGAAAFVHGSLIVTGDPDGALGAARICSGAALFPSAMVWSANRWHRTLLLVAALCWAAAGLAEMLPLSGRVVDGLLVAGGAAIGATILGISRRSVAATVAASAATTLLLVVVVLALALSAVISSSLQRDALSQLGSSAHIESAQVDTLVQSTLKDARFAARLLGTTFTGAQSGPLITIGSDAPGSTPPASASQAVSTSLQELSNLYPGGYAYADPHGTIAAAVGEVDRAVAAALVRDLQAVGLACLPGDQSVPTQGVLVEGLTAWTAAAFPVCENGSGQVLGEVLSTNAMDDAYMSSRTRADPVPTIALVSSGSVLAYGGDPPPARTLSAPLQTTGTRAMGDLLVSSSPVAVAAGSRPLNVLLVSSATNALSTRTQLYRTLFLIALGGTVLALGLAVFVGDRITSGVRRLTQVASRISSGDTALRSDVRGDDEVSVLGSVFNSMLDSVEEQASALREAADDETKLRNRMEAVVAGMTDALVAVDANGRVTDFNRAAEELTGTDAASAVGRRVDEVVDLLADDGTSLGPRLAEPGPSRWSRIATISTVDHGEVPVAVSSGAVRGPAGDLVGSVLVLRDLRSEREVERMKSEFLSRVGHELRTPLTAIAGYADLLLRRRDTSPQRTASWHAEILRASRQLERIVEMLEFSATSGAGRLMLRSEVVDVRGLVKSVTAAWSERLPPNMSLGRRVGRDVPAVMADRRWLSRALDELIGNAVKFSPDGGRIVVSALKTAGPGANGSGNAHEWVEISVSDRGQGMTADQPDLMFADFVQADGSDTRHFGGLGLGLTLVQRVVEGHGGDVRCRSILGRGSTFVIRLPAARDAQTSTITPSSRL